MSANDHHIVSGSVPSFVQRWIHVVLSNFFDRHANTMPKDWALLESLSAEEFQAYSRHGEPAKGGSNVISFQHNRKTHVPAATNRPIYRAVSGIVKQHCIESELTLPGFYAFLRVITELQKQNESAFAEDKKLSVAVNDLVSGYWEAVRPALGDMVQGQSANMEADMAALQGINQLAQESAESAPENDLDPRPPFQKTIQNDIQQALGSRPTATPTLSS